MYEGFDIYQVSDAVFEEYYDKIKKVITDNYDQENGPKFSEAFIGVIFEGIGKLVYEVSEGVEGGVGKMKEIFDVV